jgi:branched-chain amino acid transport system ATP-binding protein
MSSSPEGAPITDAVLEVRDLEVVYHDVALVLRGVSLALPRDAVVAVLGSNGAGKTTLLRAITGLLPLHNGAITKGSVMLDGERIDGHDAPAIVRAGVAQVMEGRRVFSSFTVDENLRSGAFTRRNRAAVQASYDRVLELFPKLVPLRKTTAGYLSGGEQQMVAIGRALMTDPSVLLLDEPSLGLAPLIVEQIAEIISEVNRQGTSVVLVEQNATMALRLADHGYILENGSVAKQGTGTDLLADEDIQEFYLGVGETGRRSFRDVKTYRRRKRWTA